MLDGSRPDWEMLSAYVDGELPADQAASLAQMVARDAALASALAKLHRVKAAVAGAVPDLGDAPVLDVACLRAKAGSGRSLRNGALAATLAISLAAAASWFVAGPPGRSAFPADREAGQLVLRHDAWLNGSRDAAASASVAPGGRQLIAAAGLVHVFHDRSAGEDGRVIDHDAFVGRNGCRLSLFRVEGGGHQALPGLSVDPLLLTAGWQAGESRFLLVARGMDEVRFAGIAKALRSNETRAEPSPELLAQLSTNRSPCLA